MPSIKVPLDFDGVEDFENIPAGVYAAVIDSLTWRPAKEASESSDGKAKSEQISVAYTVTDPEYEGRKLWQNLYLTPKAMFRVARFFKAFGLDYQELDADEETGIVTKPDLAGQAVEVKTFVDPYNDQNKVDEPPVPIGGAQKSAARPKTDASATQKADDAPAAGRRGGRPIK